MFHSASLVGPAQLRYFCIPNVRGRIRCYISDEEHVLILFLSHMLCKIRGACIKIVRFYWNVVILLAIDPSIYT